MLNIPRTERPKGDPWGAKRKPGWIPLVRDGRLTAYVVCPNGHEASLDDHEIAADGTVTPSLVCPGFHGKGGCNWHEHVKLEGWNE